MVHFSMQMQPSLYKVNRNILTKNRLEFKRCSTCSLLGHHKTKETLSDRAKSNLKTALKRLHELKVVHNDLKWNNIIFDPNDQVYIIDFGFARILNQDSITTDDELNYGLE